MPCVIGVSGYKNSGKTTLCGRLAALLGRDGLSVGFLKRTHEPVLPQGENDTNSLADAAPGTVLWGPDGFIGYHRDGGANLQAILAAAFPGRDVVIVEGGKKLAMPKVWVGDLHSGDDIPGIIARYAPPLDVPGVPCFPAGEEERLAEFVKGLWRKADRGPVEIYAGDRNIPVKAFVGEFIAGGVRGMVSALKNPPSEEEGLRIYVRTKAGPDGS